MTGGDYHNRYKEWRGRHEAKKLKLQWPATQEDWIQRWRESLKVIAEKATQLRNDRDVYNTYRKIVLNPELDKSNEFLLLIEDMYISHVLTGVRILDDQDTRSHSMYNLIAEITYHDQQITKDWVLAEYGKKMRSFAEDDYTRNWGADQYPDKNRLQNDLCQLTISCRNLRDICNKYIAHTDRERPELKLEYREINEAIDVVYELAERYYLLLFAAPWAGSSVDPWTDIFEIAWNRQRG